MPSSWNCSTSTTHEPHTSCRPPWAAYLLITIATVDKGNKFINWVMTIEEEGLLGKWVWWRRRGLGEQGGGGAPELMRQWTYLTVLRCCKKRMLREWKCYRRCRIPGFIRFKCSLFELWELQRLYDTHFPGLSFIFYPHFSVNFYMFIGWIKPDRPGSLGIGICTVSVSQFWTSIPTRIWISCPQFSLD